jgi:hypothetical protein
MGIRVAARWLGILLALTHAAAAQEAPAPGDDRELRAHLESLGRRVDDPATDLPLREQLALEMAATLDRAAQSAASAEERRKLWAEAADVLDRFTAKNPGHPQSRAFQVQATVYTWAGARTWLDTFRENPTAAVAKQKAAEALGACVARLEPAAGAGGSVLDQNARFRLAQALADLAEVESSPDGSRRDRNAEALRVLESPITEPSLVGFAHLLRGALLTRLGRFDEAAKALTTASAATPAPSERERDEAWLALYLGKKDFAAALKLIEGSKLDPGVKILLRVRALLAEYAAISNGARRNTVESALFADLKWLKASSLPEARAALIAAAGVVDEPGPGQEPDAWDLLAEGAAARGDLARAGGLERKGAERAEQLKLAVQARDYQLRAGAYFFQAGQYSEADPLLTRVAEDPGAGPARGRAGLLRALSRGRALAAGRPGVSQADYAKALRFLVETLPDDPAASEARWLLGKLRIAESDREGALTLWSAIPVGKPRWLESRTEIAAVRQSDLDALRLAGDHEAESRALADARAFLASCLAQTRGDSETNEILLATARLELTPGVGRPEEAQRLADQVMRSVARPAQHNAARRLNLIAVAQLGRWIEAEQIARREARDTPPAELVETVRLLDRSAAEAESDLRSRRLGAILRLLTAPMVERPESLPPALRAEARLRYVRALLFSGDDAGARRALRSLTAPPASAGNDLLRDLAETYARLDAYELAIDVQRLRTRLAPTGSIPWFDARYGLALAYYRSGKLKDALHLIDATAILHPDLGGGALREKFVRLRQRLDTPE